MKQIKRLTLAVAALLASVPLVSAQDAVRYVHLDALGSVRAVSNEANVVIERHDYLPFGEECTTGPCASNPGAGAGQPRKFTGKERDQETGLDYFGARYYGSRIGRFTTIDPVYTWKENLEDPQRWNRYAYGRDNPLRFIDPDGKQIVYLPPKLSAEDIARNARINDAIDAVMKWDPFPQDQALASIVKGLFPTREPTRLEQYIQAMGTVAGVVSVIQAPLVAVTMDEAVALGARHVGGKGVMETTGRGTNFQFRSTTTNAAGQTETRIARFDVNPADPHVQKAGPHMNLETQVNGRVTSNTHTAIDPKTVKPGDKP